MAAHFVPAATAAGKKIGRRQNLETANGSADAI